jgi:hypothetical protein
LLRHIAPKPASFLGLLTPWLLGNMSSIFWTLWSKEAFPFFDFDESFYHRLLPCLEEMGRMSPSLRTSKIPPLAFALICDFVRVGLEFCIYRAIDNELNGKQGHDALNLAILEKAETLFNVTVSNFLEVQLQGSHSFKKEVLLYVQINRLLLDVVAGTDIKLRIELARTKYQVEDICTMVFCYSRGFTSAATLVVVGLTLPHETVELRKSISKFVNN